MGRRARRRRRVLRTLGALLAMLVGLVAIVLVTGGGLVEQIGQGATILHHGRRSPPDESLVYKHTPQRELETHVFVPFEVGGHAPARRVPVVLVHGGGFTHGWPEEFFPLARDLSRRGHVVFVPEYRIHSRDETSVVEALDDVRDAIRWAGDAAERFGAESSWLVLGGSSAGAHLAAAATSIPSEDGSALPTAIGLFLSAAYLDSTGYAERIERARSEQGRIARWLRGEPQDIFRGLGAALSPSEYVSAAMPPTLMLLGGEDPLLPNARRFCGRLRAVGGDCELKTYAGAGHAYGLYGYRDYADMLETLSASIEQWRERKGAGS